MQHSIRNYNAGGAITGRRVVMFGSADDQVVMVDTAGTDNAIGVADKIDIASGEPVDVHHDGICEVEYGGNVTRGDALTFDANGKAVTQTASAGANQRVIGIALKSGADGDHGLVTLGISTFQGA